jgi:mitochondrial cardiolipin hydrolase
MLQIPHKFFNEAVMNKFKHVIFLFCIFLTVAAPCIENREPILDYEIYFSPQDHVADHLIALINKEKKSIKAAVFCMMHHGIAKALIEAHNRGVPVEIIVDPFSVKPNSPVKKMAAANLPVHVWYPPSERGKQNRKPLMHDKFCVFGNKRVWTGSFNFTFQATARNRENVIVLENENIARIYLEEFERVKEAGCIPYSTYLEERK